ncbi:MAG: AraC family transcriptional regulator [Oscillospiraceae bacterium]|nr:AraC family transcriptional regulator [Oscillospiraceae bacterium]
MEPLSYEKRGYLNENFRLFHLADRAMAPMEYHYHTFHKIIVLLAGKANYAIEGERFVLEPGNLVLVGRGTMHRPEVEQDAFYERMILYISPDFLFRCRTEDCDLETCFRRAQADFHSVYRTGAGDRLKPLLQALEQASREQDFGSGLLCQTIFLQVMIEVNRIVARSRYLTASAGDTKIIAILQYLNLHLAEPLSIDELAARFYISKFHMMRRFKEETGYTIHSYVTEKRLLLARQLLGSGGSVTEICYLAGYQDYSTFSKAYRKRFSASPSSDLPRK